MLERNNSCAAFRALTWFASMPWQEALYLRFLADDAQFIVPSFNLPKGLRKAAVIAAWLIALAHRPERMLRRLASVVNRRPAVDQTTRDVENQRRRLEGPKEILNRSPALERLRGQLAKLSSG